MDYWNRGRLFTSDIAADVLPTLVALTVYTWVGGQIPIKDFSISSIAPALLAIIIQYIGVFVVYSGYIAYLIWSLKNVLHTPTRPAINFFLIAINFTSIGKSFRYSSGRGICQGGLLEFIFIMIGLLLTALLARQFSQAAEHSRQQSNQLEQLEMLGRAILDAPPDASTLPVLLQKHVAPMFASRGILVWTESKGILLHEPPTFSFERELAWKWLQRRAIHRYPHPGAGLPGILLFPIRVQPFSAQSSMLRAVCQLEEFSLSFKP